ncbi:MAG: DUF983 domain-containing protein [Bacteroidota bacterium]|nr:DUF983 domain-containing protein [Bacteroidota bacterium]
MSSEAHKVNNRIVALFSNKCPHCHTGKVFKSAPYSLKFQVMNEDCSVCGTHYEIEPGFFWGSMYINYALTVALMLGLAFPTFYLLHDPEVKVYMGIIIVALIITLPFNFRLGRLIMLYLFSSIKFDPNAAK